MFPGSLKRSIEVAIVNLVPLHGSLLFPFKNMALHFTKETFVIPFVSAMVGSYFHLAVYACG